MSDDFVPVSQSTPVRGRGRGNNRSRNQRYVRYFNNRSSPRGGFNYNNRWGSSSPRHSSYGSEFSNMDGQENGSTPEQENRSTTEQDNGTTSRQENVSVYAGNRSTYGQANRSTHAQDNRNPFGQNVVNNIEEYIHPSMLEDPWEELRRRRALIDNTPTWKN